jgi:hypothetical protein
MPVGAAVAVSNGATCSATPCTIELPRKDEVVATFSKPGYREIQIQVTSRMTDRGRDELVGSILMGGIGGGLGYTQSGRGYAHDPNPVIADLEPLAAPPAARGKPAARRRAQPRSRRSRAPEAAAEGNPVSTTRSS